jgi:orotidine-5'-phosphate decarboxylase
LVNGAKGSSDRDLFSKPQAMFNPIIVALDVPDEGHASRLVDELSPLVGAFKVGSELFTIAGPEMIRRIRRRGAAVFLDLKFHDIPNTVAKAVAAAVRLDVQMLTVHTSGGLEMLRAAEESAQETARKAGQTPPLVLGVTVLTSLDSNELSEIGFQANAARQVERLAGLAVKAGLKGLVCSPLEVVALRQMLPSRIKLVTPGVRAPGERIGDQKRTLSPTEAIAAGATWLVIGRPIYAAPDPVAAARAICAALDEQRANASVVEPPRNSLGL